MPMRNRNGIVVGWNYRKLNKNQSGPKSTITMLPESEDSAVMAWYPMMTVIDGKLPLLLVEDQLSAVKARCYMNTAALMGTNLSETKLNEILRCGVKRVILALDNDAIVKAAELSRKFRPFFEKFTLLPLKRDIKD